MGSGFLLYALFHISLPRAGPDQQLRLLQTAYEALQGGHVPLSSLLQAMERAVLPLAKHCGTAALGRFFGSNISDLSAVLLARFTKVRPLVPGELGAF